MIDKGLLYFYLKFILTGRFKEFSKTFQTHITKRDTQQTTITIQKRCHRNKTAKKKTFETSIAKHRTDTMSTNHEAYVNPSFDPDGENIGKKQMNDGGHYNNGVSKTGKDELTKEEKYQKRKAEQAAREQERRDRDPMLLVKFITNHPKKAFAITLCGHIFFLVLTGILFASGYDILPLEFTRFPLDLTDDVDYLRGLSWDQRDEDENDIVDRGGSQVSLGQQTQLLDTLQLMFYKEDGNVLTKENLQHIKRVENEFLENKEFKTKFCLLKANGECSKPLSLIRFFDGTYSYASSVFNDPDFNNINAVINEAQRNPQTIQTFQLLIAKTAVIEPDRVESWITGSFISIGHPLKGYNYTIDSVVLDRDDEQVTEAENFVLDEIAPMGDKYFDDGVGTMDFTYGSTLYFSAWVLRQVFLDLALAGGSFLVIGIFIRIQTGSFWITGFALFGILLSFVEANIIYRVILDYRYIGIFHILSVFIVLGIGADDVFVFCDTWKETGQSKYKSLAHRLSDAYRRSALAMLFTSLTTAVAFIVSATSPFLVISAFGVFSGILITVNYISIIVYLPCVVVIHHLYFEKYKFCCCCKSSTGDISDVQQDEGEHVARDNFVVRFYSGPYFRFVTHKFTRWFITVFYAVLLAVFVYFASQLKVQEEQIKYASESVNFGKYLEIVNGQHFQASDDIRRIYVIFGLKEQDLSDCHKSDALCFGKTVWDEKFNMDSPRVQQSFLNLCSAIRNLDNETIAELQIRLNPVTKKPEVECFMEYMDTFFDEEENRMVNGMRRYPFGTDLMIPLDNDTVRLIMENNKDVYNRSLIPDDWNSDFETAASFWLYNGFQSAAGGGLESNPKFKTFDPLIGELKTKNAIETKIGAIDYYYGTKLRYAAITINTTINDADIGYIKGLPLRNQWEAVISGEIKKLEPELQNGYQTTPASARWNMWHWLKVQEVLVLNAFLGIIIGLAVALPILIIATNNIVTGFLATFTLISVTVMVIGLIPMAGWKLGLLESLNMVLVVGLAVDYTVHFAEGYSRSAHVDRKGRTRDALTEVGISVTSGAVTTCTSSCFLIFAKFVFFQQFGIFMVTTLAFSFIWATGFFMTASAIIGPQDDFGCVTKMFTSLCCKKRNNDDERAAS